MSGSQRSDSWSDVKIRPVLFWGLHSEPIRNKTKSPTSPSLVCTPENTEQNNEQKTGGAGDDVGGGWGVGGISTATEWSCSSHMGQLSIETSQKGLEVHVEEADGSKMSGVQQDGDMTAGRLSLNGSAALGLHDQGMNSALHGGFQCPSY